MVKSWVSHCFTLLPQRLNSSSSPWSTLYFSEFQCQHCELYIGNIV